jgi:predicted nucleotide-binding protein
MVKQKRPKPRVFVGSSVESLSVAYAVQQNLDHDAEVTVWPQGIFHLSAGILDSLIKALGKADFGVFVFAPSDTLRLRQKNYAAVRDNVVFEMGLFIGKLGQKRTFFVIPDGTKNLRVPTDLTGIAPGKYNARRKDKNLQAALGPFCDQVRGQIKKLRTIKKPPRPPKPKASSQAGG